MANEKNMNTRIQLKHDIEENWLKATGFIPKAGELIVYDVDDSHSTPRFKVGDGKTNVIQLSFTERGKVRKFVCGNISEEGKYTKFTIPCYHLNSSTAHIVDPMSPIECCIDLEVGGNIAYFDVLISTNMMVELSNIYLGTVSNVNPYQDVYIALENNQLCIYVASQGDQGRGLSLTYWDPYADVEDEVKPSSETDVSLPENAILVKKPEDYTTEEKTKLSGIASGAEVNVQSDWNITDTNSDAYIKNKIPFKNGTGTNSVSFVDGVAAGNYSVAGGTADKNVITDLVGSLASALVSVEPPKANANLSISLGVNNESNSVGSMTLGVSNTTGIQGYFWHTINFTNKTITLSTKRPTTISNKISAPSSIDWEVGDYLYIVNDGRYPLQSKITNISGNTLTVDSLPFEANNYDTTILGATVYPTSYTYPDDRTIYAIKINNYYEKEGDVSNLSADSKYVFRNGIADATTGFASTAIGGMNAASGILATVTGYNNLAAGRFAHAEGMKNIAGDTAHAEGCKNKALGFASHSEGLFAQSTGAMAHAEGKYTIAEGGASHAEGWNTYAAQNGAHAEGEGTNIVNEDGSITPGTTGAFGWRAHTEGRWTTANGNGAHAEGLYTISNGTGAHAEGNATYAKGANAHAEGKGTNRQIKNGDVLTGVVAGSTGALGDYSHSEGFETTARGTASHAAGIGTIANGEAQTVIGTYNKDETDALFIIGNGSSDNDRRNVQTITNDGKMTVNYYDEGYLFGGLSFTGEYLSGWYKDGGYSISPSEIAFYENDANEGKQTNIKSNGIKVSSRYGWVVTDLTYPEKQGTIAITDDIPDVSNFATKGELFSGNYNDLTNKPLIATNLTNGSSTGSLKQLNAKIMTDPANKGGTASAPTQIYPNNAVAFGSGVACGDKAFACGNTTLAYKNGAHAEGEGSIIYLDDDKTQINIDTSTGAFGWYSHTEGRKTTARGDSAHAEGRDTIAKANQTHAEGYGTIASSTSQHVQGKYNIEDSSNVYAHIVGNGSADERKNIHTVTWTGDAQYAGVVYANYDWKTKTGKELATKEYVDSKAIGGGTAAEAISTEYIKALFIV